MADQLQLRGGSSTEQASFTGASREVTVDTTLNTLRVHDGSTTGGFLLAKSADITSSNNTLATALGIASGATNFGTFSGDALSDNQSLKQILQALETLIENKASAIGITAGTTDLGTFTGSTIADSATVKAALQALETTLEAVDIDTDDMATLVGLAENVANLGTFTGSTIADNDSIKDALQSLETALELRSTIDSPVFTTLASAPEFRANGTGHLKLRAVTGNDFNLYLANEETLQITRDPSTGNPKFTAKGGSGEFKFNQAITEPSFSGHAYSPEWRATGTGHLKLRAETGNDLIVYLANQETLQVTRHSSTGNVMLTAGGGSKEFVFNQTAEFASGITIGGVSVSAGSNSDVVIGAGGATHLGTFTGSVIADNQTIKEALQALETEVDASGNEAVGDLVALSGVAANAVNLGTFTGSTISDNGTVKAGMQELESLLDSTSGSAALSTALLSATPGTVTAQKASISDTNADLGGFRQLKATEFHSNGSHLKFKTATNDIVFYPENTETLQITRSGTDVRFTSNGGSGTFKFNQEVDLAGGMKLGSVAITATGTELNYVDGVTSAVQTQLDAKAPLASPTLTGTVNLPATTNFAAASDLTLVDNTADALEIKEGSNQYISISTTDSNEKIEVFKDVYLTGERLYFDTASQIIRLKDNQASALKIENGDGSTQDFLEFVTENTGESLKFGAPNQFNNTVTVGSNGSGYDVKFYGDTSGGQMLWDASVDDLQLLGAAGLEIPNNGRFVLGSNVSTSIECALNMQQDIVFSGGGARNIKFANNVYNACRFMSSTGDIFMGMDTQGANTIFFYQPLDINTTVQVDGTFSVGVDDSGYDVKFHGATASAYMLWDESEDDLILAGDAGLVVPEGQFTLGSTAVTSTAAELNFVDGVTSNVQTQLDTKAALAGPTFTGTPAAPTASAGTNTTQLATTAFVATAVANTIDSAPGALDTLNELAAALGDDANFSTTVTNLINANETHIDNVVTLSGVAKDATNLGTFTGSTISDNGTLKAGIQELETAVETKLNTSGAAAALDVDHLITLSGVSAAADDLGTFTGSTITDNQTLKAALQLLETKVEAVQTDVDGNESDADTAIAANETHIDNMATLTGVAKDAVNLGTFTGSTINDDVTLKAAVQALETAVENKQATDAELTELATMASATAAALADLTEAEVQILDGATVTTAELNILDGVTSTATELNILDGVTSTASELNILDGVTATSTELNLLDGVTATTAELNYVDGVTSNVQTQLNAKLDSSGAKAALDVDHLITLSGVSAAADNLGTFTGSTISDNGTVKAGIQELETAVETKQAADAELTELATMASATAAALADLTEAEVQILDGATVTTAELNILDGVTADASDLNQVDGITAGTVAASKAVVVDSNKDVTGFRNVTTTGTLTVDSVGVSAIQTSAESFADNDTSLMTSAAIDDRINASDGTWTATFRGSTGEPATLVTKTGHYAKMGKMVVVTMNSGATDWTGYTGAFSITGLPFTSTSSAPFVGTFLSSGSVDETNNNDGLVALIAADSTTISVKAQDYGNQVVNWSATNNDQITLTITYFTA